MQRFYLKDPKLVYQISKYPSQHTSTSSAETSMQMCYSYFLTPYQLLLEKVGQGNSLLKAPLYACMFLGFY